MGSSRRAAREAPGTQTQPGGGGGAPRTATLGRPSLSAALQAAAPTPLLF